MRKYSLVVVGFVFMLTCMTGWSCPMCVLPNHLHESVWGRNVTIVTGKVTETRLDSNGRDEVKVEVTESLRGELKAGSSDWYDKNWCGEAVIGAQVLAFGRGGNPAAVDGGVISLSLLQEVRWLLARDFSPEDADTAAAYLTAASVILHDSGAAYFKAHPLETQQALIKRLSVLGAEVPFERALYVDDQYRFGLTALMKMPSYLSREAAIRILDEFWLLSGPKREFNEVAWILQKVQTVIAMAYRERDETLKALIGDMLRSVEGQSLSWLSQCLIISEAMTAAEIRQIRSKPEDAAWIKEALILSATLHSNMWNHSVAAALIKEAEAFGGKSSADELLASLKRKAAAGERWTSATHPWAPATPVDASWYRDSTLFDPKAWDLAMLEKTEVQGAPLFLVMLVSAAVAGLLAWVYVLEAQRRRVAASH